MKNLLTLLFIVPLLAIGQNKGIRFEQNSKWAQIKAKAKAENKHIFVDCFTTWCGPCKQMDAEIFPLEKVGTFFNTNFINLKVQMDQTKNDSEDVKSWYEEATRFTKDYKVQAYPTFLIFSPEGELVHRIIGGGDADYFIAKAKEGLDPETQYITLINKFEANPNDGQIAELLTKRALYNRDQSMAEKGMQAWINTVGVDRVLTKENINLLVMGASSSNSLFYRIIRDNMTQADQALSGILTFHNANGILANVLYKELIMPKLQEMSGPKDFDVLEKEVKKDHPYVDMRGSFLYAKTDYFGYKADWPAFITTVNELLEVSPKGLLADYTWNGFAWTAFEKFDEPSDLKYALKWSENALNYGVTPYFANTYANLWYKLGEKDKAIEWGEKAVTLAKPHDKEKIQGYLNKMKAGVPTWN